MAYSAQQLIGMPQKQLDDLFTSSPAGDIPTAKPMAPPSSLPIPPFSPAIAAIINHFGWQGKNFDPATGTLKNRITAFGINAIVAKVYKGESWLDGKECIVLDYSKTSLVAQHIRDEIRQIGPGMYLGVVYWDKTRTINFALQFPS